MKRLYIFEGAWKRGTLADLMKKGELENADLGFTWGHIWEIKGQKDGKAESIGIDLDTLRPKYSIIKEKKDAIKKLEAQIEKADEVIVFTDPDYEWEVIAFSIWHTFKKHAHKMKRAVSQEISGSALNKALSELKDLYDMNNVDAGMLRAVLDRIIGWSYSTVVYKKWEGNLTNVSAWRCQSPTLKFLTEREKEIRDFKPSDYYSILANLDFFVAGHSLNKTVDDNEKNRFSEKDKDEMLEKLKGVTEAKVTKVETSFFETSPKEPFNNAAFMSACASILGLDAKDAMECGQKLYENGYTSYIRTDAIELEPEKIEEIRSYIQENIWEDRLSKGVNKYKNPDSAQASHMAIAPVDFSVSYHDIEDMYGEKIGKVYKLIFDRALASQMANVVTEKQVISLDIKGEPFEFVAKRVVDNGFREVWKYSGDTADEQQEDSSFVSNIKEGDILPVSDFHSVAHKTKAPNRYNVASCITKMDKLRVGRPSTTASIIETLKERQYINIGARGVITVTPKWEEVCWIINGFASHDIMDFDFTKRIEDLRDGISKGNVEYRQLATEFFISINKTLKDNGVYIDDNGFVKMGNAPKKTGRECPLCKKGTLIKQNTSKGEITKCTEGKFINKKASGCSYFQYLAGASPTQDKCEKCDGLKYIFILPNGKRVKKCEYQYYHDGKTIGCDSKAEFL